METIQIQPTPNLKIGPDGQAPVQTPQTVDALIAGTQEIYIKLLQAAESQRDQCRKHGRNWKNPALYKTTICDYWASQNPCKYGSRCWYAHGPQEMRYVPRLDQMPTTDAIREAIMAAQAAIPQAFGFTPSKKSADTSPAVQTEQLLQVLRTKAPSSADAAAAAASMQLSAFFSRFANQDPSTHQRHIQQLQSARTESSTYWPRHEITSMARYSPTDSSSSEGLEHLIYSGSDESLSSPPSKPKGPLYVPTVIGPRPSLVGNTLSNQEKTQIWLNTDLSLGARLDELMLKIDEECKDFMTNKAEFEELTSFSVQPSLDLDTDDALRDITQNFLKF